MHLLAHLVSAPHAVRLVPLGLLLAALAAAGAGACDVPVYRYAMYNWSAAPYHVFYLHPGGQGEDDALRQVNRALRALARDAPPCNVAFRPVDMAEASAGGALPRLVTDAWMSHGPQSGPLHLVVSPWGHVRFSGRLDEATLAAMLDSPARREVARLLEQGNAAVLVLLEGSQAAENRRVEQVLDGVIKKAAVMGDSETVETTGDRPAGSRGLRVARVKVARTDPAERWFVENLSTVESDLAEYAREPMVFAIHGRGRTALPYVGGGITRENLLKCLAFLGGACSCEVKDDNPGADLLFRWDWDATADKLARDDDSRPLAEGQLVYHEFLPARGASGRPSPASETAPADSTTAGATGQATRAVVEPAAVTTAQAAVPTDPLAGSAHESPAPAGSFARRQMAFLGAGLVVSAIVLVLAGVVMLRRQVP